MAQLYPERQAILIFPGLLENPIARAFYNLENWRLAISKKLIDCVGQPAVAIGHCITGIVALQPDVYFMVNVTPPGVMVMLLG